MEWEDIVKRDRAFNAARTAYLKYGTEPTDKALLRCLKYGSPRDLQEASRVKLLRDHPQDFIDTDKKKGIK